MKDPQLNAQQMEEHPMEERQIEERQIEERQIEERQIKERQLKESRLEKSLLKVEQLKNQQLKNEQQKERKLNHPPMKYLIFSELVTIQKSICIHMILALLVIVCSAVIQLSMTYGNLGKYKEFAGLVEIMPMALVWMISALPLMLTECMLESSKLDTKANWIKFRLSTPVSAFGLALAKYLTMLLSIAGFLVISVIGIALLALFGNPAITMQNIQMGIMLGIVMFILVIVMQVAMLQFRSQDKAGLVMLGVMSVFIFPLYQKLSVSREAAGNDIFTMLPALTGYFPNMVMAAVLIIIVGFALTVMIFKRRER